MVTTNKQQKMPLLKKRFSNPHQQITVKPVETRRGASKIKPYKIHQQTYLNVRPIGADEILEQRAQSQACLSCAESRQNPAKRSTV